MNRALLRQAGITENEIQMLELGRDIKMRTGHGTLTVKYRNGLEEDFVPAPNVRPIERPAKARC